MNVDRQRSTTFLRLDIVLILSVVGLMALGIAFIYSSGVTSDGIQVSGEWVRQIIWSSTGLLLMAAFAMIDYRRWKQWVIPLYGIGILLLILVLVTGNYVKGARAWLGIGSVGVQPSEFMKLASILMLAWWFEERGRGIDGLRVWIGAFVITLIPMGLILLQPDLGTAIVYIPILFAMAFCAGVRWNLLLFPLLAGILMILGTLGYAWSEYITIAPSGFFRLFTEKRMISVALPSLLILTILALLGRWFFQRRSFSALAYIFGVLSTAYAGVMGAAKVLKGYQMMRLVVFLDPQTDPRGAGWNIIQSVTAIGSGGAFGKGYLQGTQSHYRYLPEQSTDFIFSILAEETGFVGSLFVFTLFAIIILRSLYIAYTAKDTFGSYTAVGIAAMMSFHVMQNIGMAIGVMPITGIPLFFLSYGGSSLWMALMCMGLLLSIHYRRHKI
ncbi:MAG: rod shape-determining protein RodA [Spirochaetales bacterium]|nr:rod shape-determining protein RodA [Spirochaetales bacterium]